MPKNKFDAFYYGVGMKLDEASVEQAGKQLEGRLNKVVDNVTKNLTTISDAVAKGVKDVDTKKLIQSIVDAQKELQHFQDFDPSKLKDQIDLLDTSVRNLTTDLGDVKKLLQSFTDDVSSRLSKIEILTPKMGADALKKDVSEMKNVVVDLNKMIANGQTDISTDVIDVYIAKIKDGMASIKASGNSLELFVDKDIAKEFIAVTNLLRQMGAPVESLRAKFFELSSTFKTAFEKNDTSKMFSRNIGYQIEETTQKMRLAQNAIKPYEDRIASLRKLVGDWQKDLDASDLKLLDNFNTKTTAKNFDTIIEKIKEYQKTIYEIDDAGDLDYQSAMNKMLALIQSVEGAMSSMDKQKATPFLTKWANTFDGANLESGQKLSVRFLEDYREGIQYVIDEIKAENDNEYNVLEKEIRQHQDRLYVLLGREEEKETKKTSKSNTVKGVSANIEARIKINQTEWAKTINEAITSLTATNEKGKSKIKPIDIKVTTSSKKIADEVEKIRKQVNSALTGSKQTDNNQADGVAKKTTPDVNVFNKRFNAFIDNLKTRKSELATYLKEEWYPALKDAFTFKMELIGIDKKSMTNSIDTHMLTTVDVINQLLETKPIQFHSNIDDLISEVQQKVGDLKIDSNISIGAGNITVNPQSLSNANIIMTRGGTVVAPTTTSNVVTQQPSKSTPQPSEPAIQSAKVTKKTKTKKKNTEPSYIQEAEEIIAARFQAGREIVEQAIKFAKWAKNLSPIAESADITIKESDFKNTNVIKRGKEIYTREDIGTVIPGKKITTEDLDAFANAYDQSTDEDYKNVYKFLRDMVDAHKYHKQQLNAVLEEYADSEAVRNYEASDNKTETLATDIKSAYKTIMSAKGSKKAQQHLGNIFKKYNIDLSELPSAKSYAEQWQIIEQQILGNPNLKFENLMTDLSSLKGNVGKTYENFMTLLKVSKNYMLTSNSLRTIGQEASNSMRGTKEAKDVYRKVWDSNAGRWYHTQEKIGVKPSLIEGGIRQEIDKLAVVFMDEFGDAIAGVNTGGNLVDKYFNTHSATFTDIIDFLEGALSRATQIAVETRKKGAQGYTNVTPWDPEKYKRDKTRSEQIPQWTEAVTEKSQIEGYIKHTRALIKRKEVGKERLSNDNNQIQESITQLETKNNLTKEENQKLEELKNTLANNKKTIGEYTTEINKHTERLSELRKNLKSADTKNVTYKRGDITVGYDRAVSDLPNIQRGYQSAKEKLGGLLGSYVSEHTVAIDEGKLSGADTKKVQDNLQNVVTLNEQLKNGTISYEKYVDKVTEAYILMRNATTEEAKVAAKADAKKLADAALLVAKYQQEEEILKKIIKTQKPKTTDVTPQSKPKNEQPVSQSQEYVQPVGGTTSPMVVSGGQDIVVPVGNISLDGIVGGTELLDAVNKIYALLSVKKDNGYSSRIEEIKQLIEVKEKEEREALEIARKKKEEEAQSMAEAAKKVAEDRRKKEEARAETKRIQEEETRKAEETAKKAEEERLRKEAEDARKREEAQAEAKRIQEEEVRRAEEARRAEETRKAEEKAQAEAQRKQEEARIQAENERRKIEGEKARVDNENKKTIEAEKKVAPEQAKPQEKQNLTNYSQQFEVSVKRIIGNLIDALALEDQKRFPEKQVVGTDNKNKALNTLMNIFGVDSKDIGIFTQKVVPKNAKNKSGFGARSKTIDKIYGNLLSNYSIDNQVAEQAVRDLLSPVKQVLNKELTNLFVSARKMYKEANSGNKIFRELYFGAKNNVISSAQSGLIASALTTEDRFIDTSGHLHPSDSLYSSDDINSMAGLRRSNPSYNKDVLVTPNFVFQLDGMQNVGVKALLDLGRQVNLFDRANSIGPHLTEVVKESLLQNFAKENGLLFTKNTYDDLGNLTDITKDMSVLSKEVISTLEDYVRAMSAQPNANDGYAKLHQYRQQLREKLMQNPDIATAMTADESVIKGAKHQKIRSATLIQEAIDYDFDLSLFIKQFKDYFAVIERLGETIKPNSSLGKILQAVKELDNVEVGSDKYNQLIDTIKGHATLAFGKSDTPHIDDRFLGELYAIAKRDTSGKITQTIDREMRAGRVREAVYRENISGYANMTAEELKVELSRLEDIQKNEEVDPRFATAEKQDVIIDLLKNGIKVSGKIKDETSSGNDASSSINKKQSKQKIVSMPSTAKVDTQADAINQLTGLNKESDLYKRYMSARSHFDEAYENARAQGENLTKEDTDKVRALANEVTKIGRKIIETSDAFEQLKKRGEGAFADITSQAGGLEDEMRELAHSDALQSKSLLKDIAYDESARKLNYSLIDLEGNITRVTLAYNELLDVAIKTSDKTTTSASKIYNAIESEMTQRIGVDDIIGTNSKLSNSKQYVDYIAQYDAMIDAQETLRAKGTMATQAEKDQLISLINKVQGARVEFEKLAKASVEFDAKIRGGDTISVVDPVNIETEMKKFVLTQDGLTKSQKDMIEQTWVFKNAQDGATYSVQKGKGELAAMSVIFDQGTQRIGQYTLETKKHTTGMEKFMNSLKGKWQEVARYLMTFGSMYRVFAVLKQGVGYITEIDSALTELKKVTNETEETYDRFLQTAAKTADKVGSTIQEIVSSTADWARLGYNIKEAANLAESTAILLNVSEFQNIEDATSALTSTLQAFGYTAKDSMNVVDVLNEVGNNFAISSDGIATALQDSASSLMAANNSYQEAVALIASANRVVQDPNSVGAALRTISLRLRGTSTEELEEAGEDTTGAITSKSKLRSKIQGYTGIDILTDSGAYKSTYEILLEISKVWDDLTDMNRAGLLELIAGKTRSNTAAAILSNTKDLEEAYKSAMEAEGSAYEENEKYLDSIQGRIDLFNNAVQTMWSNTLDSDVIKGFVNLGTELIKIVDKLGLINTLLVGVGVFAAKKYDLFGSLFGGDYDGFDDKREQLEKAKQDLERAIAKDTSGHGNEKTAQKVRDAEKRVELLQKQIDDATPKPPVDPELDALIGDRDTFAKEVDALKARREELRKAVESDSPDYTLKLIEVDTTSIDDEIAETQEKLNTAKQNLLSAQAEPATRKVRGGIRVNKDRDKHIADASQEIAAIEKDLDSLQKKKADTIHYAAQFDLAEMDETINTASDKLDDMTAAINAKTVAQNADTAATSEGATADQIATNAAGQKTAATWADVWAEMNSATATGASVGMTLKQVIANKLASNELVKKGLAAMVTSGAITAETAAEAANLPITTLLTAGFIGLGTSIKIVTMKMWELMTTTPLGPILLAIAGAIAAIAIAAKAIDNKWVTAKEAKENLEELNSEIDSLTSDLESLNSELETTQERMEELLSKDSLSFTEQEELNNLKLQNAQLERQIELQKLILENKKKEQQSVAQDVIEKTWSNKSYGKEDYQVDWNDGVIKKDNFWSIGMSGKDAINEGLKKYKQTKANHYVYETYLNNALEEDRPTESYEKKLKEIEAQLSSQESGINMVLGEMSDIITENDLQYGQSKEINEFLDEYNAMTLKWQEAQGLVGNSDIIKSIFNTSDTDGVQNLKQQLDEIANSSENNAIKQSKAQKIIGDAIKSTDEDYQRLKTTMDILDMSVEELAEAFIAVSEAPDISTFGGVLQVFADGEEILKSASTNLQVGVDELGEAITWGNLFKKVDGKKVADNLKVAAILEGADKDVRDQFVKIVEEVENGKMSVDEALAKWEMVGVDKAVDALNTEFEALNNEMFPDATDEISGMIDSVNELQAAFESVASSMDLFNTAQKQMNSSGRISIKTALEIMNTTEEWDKILTITEDSITFNKDAEEALIQTELDAIATQSQRSAELAKTKYEAALAAQTARELSEAEADVATTQNSANTITDQRTNEMGNLATQTYGTAISELDYADNDDVVQTAESVKAKAIGLVSAGIVGLDAAIQALLSGEGFGGAVSAWSSAYNEARSAVIADANSYTTTVSALKKDYENKQALANVAANGDQYSDFKDYYDYDKTPGDKYDDSGDALDNLRKKYERQIKNLDNQQTYLQNEIDRLEAENKAVSKSYYEEQIALEEKKLDLYEQEREALLKLKMTDEVAEALWEVEHAIQESTLNMVEFRKSIVTLYKTAFDDVVEAYDNKDDFLSDQQNYIEKYRELMELQGEVPDAYGYQEQVATEEEKMADNIAELNSLRQTLAEGMASGAIEEGSEDWIQMQDQIRATEEAVLDNKIAIEQYRKELKQLSVDAFELVREAFSNKDSFFTNQQEYIQGYADLLEAQGIDVPAEIYDELIKLEQEKRVNNVANLVDARQGLANLEAEGYTAADEEWQNAYKQVVDLEKAIQDNDIAMANYAKTIRDLDFEKFERFVKRLDDTNSEIDNLRGLYDDEDVAFEDGTWTKEGITSLGLLYHQMELNQGKSEEYAEKIEELNQAYDNGEMSEQEYYESLQELKDGQWDAINAYESAKDAIVDLEEARIDMIEEGINKEIEAYEDLIEVKKEELDAERDLYEFKKDVQKQTKDIESLERRLASLSGSTDASDIAEKRRLEAELYEAKEGLNDTYYNHAKDQQSQALDDEVDAYRDAQEKYLETLRDTLQFTEEIINEKISEFLLNSDVALETLNQTADEHKITLSTALIQPWQDAANESIAFKDSAGFNLSSLTNEDGIITIFGNDAKTKLEGVFNAGGIAATNFATSVGTQIEAIKLIVDESTSLLTASINFPWNDVIREDGPISTFSTKAGDALNTALITAQNNAESMKTALTSPWVDGTDAVNTFSSNVKIALDEVIEKAEEAAAAISKVEDPSSPSYVGNGNDTTTNPDPSSPSTNLKKDPKVVAIQNYLNKYFGADIDEDGKYGPDTIAAVKAMQKKIGVPTDGKYGTGTVNALKKYWDYFITNTRNENKGSSMYGQALKEYTNRKNSVPAAYYAKGTLGTKRDELAITDESWIGEEITLAAGKNGQLQYLKKGSAVMPADISANLVEWGKLNPDMMRVGVGTNLNMISNAVVQPNYSFNFDSLVHVDHCDEGTLKNLEKMVDNKINDFSKQLNYSIKKFAR